MGSNSSNPFSPTTFYGALKAIISHFITFYDKWYYRLGCPVELKNVVLLAKQDKIRKYIQKYNLVGNAPENLRWDDGRSFAQIFISLNFLKEVHVIFYEVWFLKHFSHIPEHARKTLIRNIMGWLEFLIIVIKIYQLNI